MNLHQHLDFYCERLGAGLWAEPLNTLSNLAFFAAAWLLLRKRDDSTSPSLFWPALLGLIGMGSLAFHIFATVWAHWLDLIFIELFIYSFIAFYLRRVFQLGALSVILLLFGYALFEWLLTGTFSPGALNGSYRYLPALILIALMTALASRHSPAMMNPLILATAIFALAIVCRTLDMALCGAWPSGTHFIWHMLNAAVLYFSVIALHRRDVSGIKTYKEQGTKKNESG